MCMLHQDDIRDASRKVEPAFLCSRDRDIAVNEGHGVPSDRADGVEFPWQRREAHAPRWLRRVRRRRVSHNRARGVVQWCAGASEECRTMHFRTAGAAVPAGAVLGPVPHRFGGFRHPLGTAARAAPPPAVPSKIRSRNLEVKGLLLNHCGVVACVSGGVGGQSRRGVVQKCAVRWALDCRVRDGRVRVSRGGVQVCKCRVLMLSWLWCGVVWVCRQVCAVWPRAAAARWV